MIQYLFITAPIKISYATDYKYTFKDGYFFSIAPGFYKPNDFGMKLKNVLEVVDTEEFHDSGGKFLQFRTTTLVPFEPKFIDYDMLSDQEVKISTNVCNNGFDFKNHDFQKMWLNEYNLRIQELVGNELQNQNKMHAYYWMMNKTNHIPYSSESSRCGKFFGSNIRLHVILIGYVSYFVNYLLIKSHL